MNYLLEELLDFSNNKLEKIDLKVSPGEGYFIYDLVTSEYLWLDSNFWSILGCNAIDYLDDVQNWKNFIESENFFNSLDLSGENVIENEAITMLIKCKHTTGSLISFIFKGYIHENSCGIPTRLIGTYCKLEDIKRKELDHNYSVILRNLSHEFRTPLNGILGTIQLIKSTNLTQEQSMLIDLSMESTKTLSNVICDMLTYSAFHINNEEIQIKPWGVCIFSELVNELELLFKSICIVKGLELKVKLSKKIPKEFKGDCFLWRQVLINLLDNAVKYSEGGIVNIEVFYKNNGRIELLISDQGKGMESKTLKEISKPFLREDTSLSNTSGGLGVGLATVFEIINDLNGEIKFWSQKDIGTKVYFEVPVEEIR